MLTCVFTLAFQKISTKGLRRREVSNRVDFRKNRTKFLEKLFNYIRPSLCTELFRNCSTAKSIDTDQSNDQRLRLKHDSCKMRISNETFSIYHVSLQKNFISFLMSRLLSAVLESMALYEIEEHKRVLSQSPVILLFI